MKFHISVLVAISFVAALPSFAQVEVVDSQPIEPRPAVDTHAGAERSVNDATQLYFQLQTLQQEVLELRGLLEEQAHHIKKLKQQRLDDYLDLDRRIGQLSQTAVALSPSVDGGTSVTPALREQPDNNTNLAGSANALEERQVYTEAIDLVIKKRDFDQAIMTLNQLLVDYPDGLYAGNAKYWLGQIYMRKEELQESAAWFKRFVGSHPNHAKISDAKLKLGKVYHLLGRNSEAKSLLEDVSQAGGAAAGLADTYLKSNF